MSYLDAQFYWPSTPYYMPGQSINPLALDTGILRASQGVPIIKGGTLGAVTFRTSVAPTPQPLRISYRTPHASANARPALTDDQFVDIPVPAPGVVYTVTPTADGTPGGAKRVVVPGDVVWVTIGWIGSTYGGVSIYRTLGSTYTHDFLRYAYNYVDGNWFIDHPHMLMVGLQYTDGSWAKSIGGDRAANYSANEVMLQANLSPDEVGLKFVAPFTMRVAGFSLKHYNNGANIVVSLYDDTDTLLATKTYPARFTYNASNLYPFIFSAPADLVAGHTYRVTARPESGTTSFYFYDYDTFYLGAEDGGATTMKTARTDGGAWTDTPGNRVHLQLIVTGIAEGLEDSMADTRRTLAALQALLADNTTGAITAQAVRDVLVSVHPENTARSGLLAALPTTGRVVGDTYYPTDAPAIYRWNGTAWVAHGV